MRKVLIFSLVVLAMFMFGCACGKSRGGSASPDDLEGNIPLAEAEGALADVNFAFDSSALTESTKGTLRENAKWIAENAEQKITIEGHCDERGTNEYNFALGERRAKAVQDFLRSLGISGEQMSTISYGEELPLDPASTEAAWSKNRRAHFSLTN